MRFTTAGSVDDGKSTLIGRLLYDSKSIYQDQIEAIEKASKRRGEDHLNLALLTDGLKSEREQGITIDVAYRYFSTPKRKFIIADTPGHKQYTRNMITGASSANTALILVDARKGLIEQTKRHAIIASLLQIPHLAICINKMDLINFKEDDYNKIKKEITEFVSKLDVKDVVFIPISALLGDNVVNRSVHMDWYKGSTLMHYLEHVHIASDNNLIDVRFPIQRVIRTNNEAFHDFRAYAGRLAGGIIKKGDEVHLLPSGFDSKIKSIIGPNGELTEAITPQSIMITLEDEFDLGRGDMLVRSNNKPKSIQDIDIMLCWFDDEKPLKKRGKYIVKHTTQEVRAMVKEVLYKMNIETLHREEGDKTIALNDIARVKLRLTKPIFVDEYRKNRVTGSIILIDETTNNTVGAGMII